MYSHTYARTSNAQRWWSWEMNASNFINSFPPPLSLVSILRTFRKKSTLYKQLYRSSDSERLWQHFGLPVFAVVDKKSIKTWNGCDLLSFLRVRVRVRIPFDLEMRLTHKQTHTRTRTHIQYSFIILINITNHICTGDYFMRPKNVITLCT